jgi:lipopolysaccharide transport system permease protein
MHRKNISLRGIASDLLLNKDLIFASTKREVLLRYRGSFFGVFWSFFNPILMLCIYTFVFNEVFKAKWGGSSLESSRIEFALLLFAGIIIFNFFSECLSKSPYQIVSNQNYVKKVVYPIEIISMVGVLSAAYQMLLNLLIWVIFYFVFIGWPHLTILYVPVILIPLFLGVLGISWFFSSLGVFLRDINQIVGVITTVSMFLSPIFFPADAVPENIRFLIYFNPLTIFIEELRNVIYWGGIPGLFNIFIMWAGGIIIFSLGYYWFQKTRKGFADVL